MKLACPKAMGLRQVNFYVSFSLSKNLEVIECILLFTYFISEVIANVKDIACTVNGIC